jgi:hypothetical protein
MLPAPETLPRTETDAGVEREFLAELIAEIGRDRVALDGRGLPGRDGCRLHAAFAAVEGAGNAEHHAGARA